MSVYRRRVSLNPQFQPKPTRRGKPPSDTSGTRRAIDCTSHLGFRPHQRSVTANWLPRGPPAIVGPLDEHAGHPLPVHWPRTLKTKCASERNALDAILTCHCRQDAAPRRRICTTEPSKWEPIDGFPPQDEHHRCGAPPRDCGGHPRKQGPPQSFFLAGVRVDVSGTGLPLQSTLHGFVHPRLAWSSASAARTLSAIALKPSMTRCCTAASPVPMIRAAIHAAFFAPALPIATVATGTPGGI